MGASLHEFRPRHPPRPEPSLRSDSPATAPVSLIVVADHAQAHIGRCLASCRDWVQEMTVIVSSPLDTTIDVAISYDARVLINNSSRPLDRAAFALAQAESPWTLLLDHRSLIPPRLRRTICSLVKCEDAALTAVRLRVLNLMHGRWLRLQRTVPAAIANIIS